MISSYVSKKTLNELDKIILDYKVQILDDINKNFNLNIDKETFRNMYLKREEFIVNIKKNEDIDFNKCYAIVYYKKYGYNQCKRNKTNVNYCSLHCENQYYGSVI